MQLSVNLAGLTWGDLYNFVDAARGAEMQEEEAVELVTSSGSDDEIVALSVQLPDLARRVAVLGHDQRIHYADVLATVLNDDGDARGALLELESLRDLLVGG